MVTLLAACVPVRHDAGIDPSWLWLALAAFAAFLIWHARATR